MYRLHMRATHFAEYRRYLPFVAWRRGSGCVFYPAKRVLTNVTTNLHLLVDTVPYHGVTVRNRGSCILRRSGREQAMLVLAGTNAMCDMFVHWFCVLCVCSG
jgi:hypothetical protein